MRSLVNSVGFGEDCISDANCDQCLFCNRGICTYSPFGSYCTGCSPGGCGATSSTCIEPGATCAFSPAGSCGCDGNGVCSHGVTGWWCEPICPSSVSSTCTVTCGACGNPKTCSPGGGEIIPEPCDPCVCNCNMDNIWAPQQITNVYTPLDGAVFTNEVVNFSWGALPDDPVVRTPDAWGFNVKRCGNGYCPDGKGGFDCPSGAGEDGTVHQYLIAVWDSSDINSTPLYRAYVNASTTSVSSDVFGAGAFNSCSTYYWAVRAVNRNPLLDPDDLCIQTDQFGPWSPVRSFRTNCAPSIISVTPSGGVSGRYAYDGQTPTPLDPESKFVCTRNNPTQFKLTVQDPDGVDDINLTGLWIHDENEDYSPNYYSNSIHTINKKGTFVYIIANGTQVGGEYAQMGLYINNKLVQIWNNVGASGKDLYRYYSKTAVKASDIKVSFMNDAYNPSQGEDRNLTEVELYLNGVAQTSASFACTVPCANPPNCGSFASRQINGNGSECWFQYIGDTTYGQNIPVTYGMRYISTNNVPGGLTNWKNFFWGVPTNGYNSSANKYLTTMIGAPLYADLENQDITSSNFKGHIKLISVMDTSGTTREYTYEVIFGGDNNSKIGSNLEVSGYVSDFANAKEGWVIKATHRLDFRPPTLSLSTSIIDKNNIGLSYRAIDEGTVSTGVVGVKGYGTFLAKNPSYSGDTGFLKTVPAGIEKKNNGILGSSSPIISSLNNIWDYANNHNSSPFNLTVDITNVEEAGTFNFGIKAVDNVCNISQLDTTTEGSVPLGSSWIITKGGLSYSRAGYESDTQDLLPADDSVHSSFVSPFQVKKGEANISTELLASGNSLVKKYSPRTSPYEDFNPSILKNMSSSLVSSGVDFWTEYRNRFLEKYRTEQSEFTKVDGISNLSGNVSTICPDSSKKCVVNSNNNLTVNANLVCDRQTLLIIPGNLTIQKQISLGNIATELDGCIFLVKGLINIEAFGEPVPADVEYDKIEGFFISADQIHIFNDNAPQPRGVKVNGSLIGLGTNAVSIRFGRTLQLRQNLEHPSAVMHYDSRYLIIAREFFGERSAYRKDSGFKPF